jgi:hypothetical protein
VLLVEWPNAVLLSGIGAVLAGAGAFMSGWAALHLARKGDKEGKEHEDS